MMFSKYNNKQVFKGCSGGARRNEYWHNLVCGHIINTRPSHADCGPNCAGNGDKPSTLPFMCSACGDTAVRWCRMYDVESETRRISPASSHTLTFSDAAPLDFEPMDADFSDGEVSNGGYMELDDDEDSPDQIWDIMDTSSNEADDKIDVMVDYMDTNTDVDMDRVRSRGSSARDVDMDEVRSRGSPARWSTSPNARSSPPPVWDSSDDEASSSHVPACPNTRPQPPPAEFGVEYVLPHGRILPQSGRFWRWAPTGRRQVRLEEEMRRMNLNHRPYRCERERSRSRSPERVLQSMSAPSSTQRSTSAESERHSTSTQDRMTRSRSPYRVLASGRIARVQRQRSTSAEREHRPYRYGHQVSKRRSRSPELHLNDEFAFLRKLGRLDEARALGSYARDACEATTDGRLVTALEASTHAATRQRRQASAAIIRSTQQRLELRFLDRWASDKRTETVAAAAHLTQRPFNLGQQQAPEGSQEADTSVTGAAFVLQSKKVPGPGGGGSANR
ncbi:hypothetical protein IWX90DRAFT_482974 [Phyllosticta citrichinensis]|uniref:Uncharacterized protein n=1 Tax=Phyllosticta citrichinensis TaxID=1130410 RepID=A0ABR1Y8T8_9PEZI